MKMLILIFALLILSACAAPAQGPGETRASSESVFPSTTSVLPVAPTAPPTLSDVSPTRLNTPRPRLTAPPESSVILNLGDATHLIDLTTGMDVPGYAPINGGISARAADAGKMATVVSRGQSCEPSGEPSGGGTACYPAASALDIIDVQTWRAVTNTLLSRGWASPLIFSPSAARVALALNQVASSSILLVDARTAQLVTQRALQFRPSQLIFSQDENMLAAYGEPFSDRPYVTQPPPPRMVLLDASTLEPQWEQSLVDVVSGSWCIETCQGNEGEQLSAYWNPAVVPSQDGRQLYIIHADADKLTTVDFSTRTIRTAGIQTARSGFDNFLALFANVAEAKGGVRGVFKNAVLSPDGARLYVISSTMTATRDSAKSVWDTTYRIGELQVIDVQSGRQLAALALANHQAVGEYLQEFSLTPDGARVLVAQSDHNNKWWTEIFDAQTLVPVARLDGWRVFVARRVDGQPILLAHQPNSTPMQLAVIDPKTFTVVRAWSLKNDAGWVTAP